MKSTNRWPPLSRTTKTALRWLACPAPNLEKVRVLAKRAIADALRASQIIERIRAAAIRQPPKHTFLSLSDVIEESVELASSHKRSPWARTTPYHIATKRVVCCASQQKPGAHVSDGSFATDR
jgi:hypothetical protein